MTNYTDIIERLKKATGPDRELDYRIAYALGWRFSGFEWNEQSRDQNFLSDEEFHRLDQMAGGWKQPDQKKWPCPGTNENEIPEWTVSIDAALTLVPEGLCGSIAFGTHSGAILWPRDPRKNLGEHRGATAAIALCIASLKARMASNDH